MTESKLYAARALVVMLLTAAMLLCGLPVTGASPTEPGVVAPRAITDNAKDLIIPAGESYQLSGSHTYSATVQINGTLKVVPYDGSGDGSGILTMTAPWIIVGPAGKVQADGRGYGGGGGGTCYPSGGAGGSGGTGGLGGNGANAYQEYYAGGGGGGSTGGIGGKQGPGGMFTAGNDGTDTSGGNGGGYDGWNCQGGTGGKGFGGGGGGAGDEYYGGGGGGGGGTGGMDAKSNTGANGGGSYGGAGGTSNYYGSGGPGDQGGYMAVNANGDTTTDTSVAMGSGGGGGGSASYECGGAGGGGAGGAGVQLISSGDMIISGAISATGAPGGGGGSVWGSNTGGVGGGGAGGGITLMALTLSITGTVDAQGRQGSTLSVKNGGTVKLLYDTNDFGSAVVTAGRVYSNGRPKMQGLLSPAENGAGLLKTVFEWTDAKDPEGDAVRYQIQASASKDFKTLLINAENIVDTQYTSNINLIGAAFYWRVRARDTAGYGGWSDAWKFFTDITPPVSQVVTLSQFTNLTDFMVSWTGTDDSSGIAAYTIWVAMDNQTFRPWLNDTTNLSAYYQGRDGHKYSFYSSAIDRAENRELAHLTPDTYTTVDTTPPSSSMIVTPYESNRVFQVAWSSRDNTSGIAWYTVFYSDNNGDFSVWEDMVTQTSAQFQGKEGHQYSFYVIASDNAGNIEQLPGPAGVAWTKVDLTSPITELSLGEPNFGQSPAYITPSTPIFLQASDSYAGVNDTFYIIDKREAKEYTGSIIESQSGSHNISFWSIDRAGNRENQGWFWFLVDRDPPITNLVINGPNWTGVNEVFASAQTSIVLEGVDAASGVNWTEYNLDNHGYVHYAKPLTFMNPGTHSLTYRSVDKVGNVGAEKNLKIVADTQPPVTKAAAPSTVSRETLNINLSATDADSGVAGTYFRVIRGNAKPGDFHQGTSVVIDAADDHSADGNYSIQFYSMDNVGNTERVQELHVKIDTIVNYSLGFKGDITVSDSTYIFQGNTEPGSKVTINGIPILVAADGSFTTEIDLQDGRNKVVVSINDPAGNSITKTAYITYNKPILGSDFMLPLIVVVIIAAAVGIATVMFMRRRKGARSATPAPPPASATVLPAARPPVPPPVPPTVPPAIALAGADRSLKERERRIAGLIPSIRAGLPPELQMIDDDDLPSFVVHGDKTQTSSGQSIVKIMGTWYCGDESRPEQFLKKYPR